MRLALFFVLNISLSFAVELFFPWWSITIVSGIIAMILFPKYSIMLAMSFVSIFIYWSSVAFYLSMNNHHLLLQKIARLWDFDEYFFIPLIMIGCIGGVVSVVGASVGYWIRYFYINYKNRN